MTHRSRRQTETPLLARSERFELPTLGFEVRYNNNNIKGLRLWCCASAMLALCQREITSSLGRRLSSRHGVNHRPIVTVRSCGNRAVSAGVVDHGRTLLISSTKVPTTFATSGTGRELPAPTNWWT